MKVLFTCGGTAGHINPALAVASRLCGFDPSTEVLFIGAEGNMECSLVPGEGYGIKTIRITNISRALSLEGLEHNIDTFKNVITSRRAAEKIIREFSPDIAVGTGGYVCFPVITAAHRLGIPTVIHESNSTPGLTTKLLSRVTDRVLVGVEGCAEQYPDPSKVIYTGTPVRSGFGGMSKAEAKEKLGLPAGEPLVVSVWGSLGAGRMNELVLDMIPLMKNAEKPLNVNCNSATVGDNLSPATSGCGFRLIHATGKRYYDGFMKKLTETCPDYRNYGADVREYINDMPLVMTAADVIMCRSGASTLSELAYMGKPALLVPSPNVTNNHQEKNARVVESAGAATVLLEDSLDSESLLATIKDMLSNPERLEKMSASAGGLCKKNAAGEIADIILGLV